MADLMGVPRVRQALQGKQLSPKDRERLNSYARYCLKFQSKDLTVEVSQRCGVKAGRARRVW